MGQDPSGFLILVLQKPVAVILVLQKPVAQDTLTPFQFSLTVVEGMGALGL